MRRLAPALLVALLGAGLPSTASAQPSTWHSRQARVSAAGQALGRHGQGVLVAVVDTWVDTAHPSFGGRALPTVDCVGGCTKAAARDNCSHGTHVAGTVASAEYGVAAKARVLPLRILAWNGEQCTGNTDDAAAAVRYAVAQGADVINLSVGGDTPLIGSATALPGAVADAAAAGVVVVFAAGNQGYPVADSYGGNALIVGATGPSGALASYSQRGVGVDVGAPGGDPFDGESCRSDGTDCVASLAPDGHFAAMAGTSMAAPHVAGLAALLIAQRPSRGRAGVMSAITSTARPVSGAGSGLIDADAALGVRPAPPSPAPTTAGPRPQPIAPATTREPVPAGPPTPVPSRAANPTPSLSPSPPAGSSGSASPQVALLDAPRESGRVPAASVAAGLLVALLFGHAVRWRQRGAGGTVSRG